MSFLNWMLLGGAAAFTLPLLIHLLNRSRFQLVDWGAMHLLESALQANSRRMQWQSLLLLLLRCAIPILLAVALARPVLTQWRIPGSGGDKSIVLLIDNSLSMDRASTVDPSTCFDLALKQAAEILGQQSATTEFSIWTIGGVPTDILVGTTFDRRRALAKLQALRGGAGSLLVQTALAAGLKQSQQMQNANREIIVISDFQSGDWQGFNDSEQTAWKLRVAAEAVPPRVVLMNIEPAAARLTNLSVDLVALETPVIVAGQSFPITADVRNHGNTVVEDATVVLQVGEVELTSRRISIPAMGKTQVVFACQIDSPGQHDIEIHVDDAFGVSGDNRVYHVVDVRNSIRVLIIDGQPTAPLLKRSSGYLSLALSPFQGPEATKNYAITHSIAANQIKPQVLNEHDVVIMADLPRLENSAAEAIAAFVNQGGGLLLFAGNALELNWYNTQWGATSKSPLLPAMYNTPPQAALPKNTSALPDSKIKIQSSTIAHPALKEFARPGAGDLASVEIRRVIELQLDDASPAAAEVNATESQVIMRLESDQPLLVAKRYGEGEVLQFAIAADDGWSNFPLRPAFVPLMQGLVQWLAAGTNSEHNLTTGQAVTLFPNKGREVASDAKPASSTNIDVVFTTPNGEPISKTLPADSPVSFDETAFPGIYRVSRGQGNQPESLFAVNLPAAESKPQTLATSELQELARALDATQASTTATYFARESLRNNGRELWRILILALVVGLFVELWLQQRIARGAA